MAHPRHGGARNGGIRGTRFVKSKPLRTVKNPAAPTWRSPCSATPARPATLPAQRRVQRLPGLVGSLPNAVDPLRNDVATQQHDVGARRNDFQATQNDVPMQRNDVEAVRNEVLSVQSLVRAVRNEVRVRQSYVGPRRSPVQFLQPGARARTRGGQGLIRSKRCSNPLSPTRRAPHAVPPGVGGPEFLFGEFRRHPPNLPAQPTPRKHDGPWSRTTTEPP